MQGGGIPIPQPPQPPPSGPSKEPREKPGISILNKKNAAKTGSTYWVNSPPVFCRPLPIAWMKRAFASASTSVAD